MTSSKFYISLFPLVFVVSVCCSQPTITHGHADTMTTASFAYILTLPDTDRTIHTADDEDKMKIPYRLPVPKTANIQYENPNVPNFNGVNHNGPPPMSPAPTTNFTGITDNQSYIPPDVNGAVGPNNLMITLNSQVSTSNKTGGSVNLTSLYNFWTGGGLSIAEAFDPKVLYDPYSQRWILVSFADPERKTTGMMVAVSLTNDPTGSWYFYRINADTSGTTWMDYPSVGFNKNWIVVNGNIYNTSSGNWESTRVYILDKSNFYAGGAGTYTLVSDSNIGGTIAPAATYDSTVTTEYLMSTWDGPAGYIRLFTITGAVGSETFTPGAYINTTNFWGDQGAAGWNLAPQKGTSNLISVNDDRMLKLVYRNGDLWCTHNVFFPSTNPTRCSVQWWEVSTAGAVLQRGLIDDPTGAKMYAFPSIAVNSNNDAMIGYSSFDTSQYASGDYSFRAGCDASNTLESDYLYKEGVATYYKLYSGTNNRWGDYTATCVDPTNDLDLWTIQEYADTHAANDSSTWGTWWAELSRSDGGAGTWTWTGTTSTDWFNRCNWDKLTLPNSLSDVVIPGGTTNEPTISGATAKCNTLSIKDTNGGRLTLNSSSSGALIVTQ